MSQGATRKSAPSSVMHRRTGRGIQRAARAGVAAALLAVLVTIAVLVFNANSSYTLRADFQNASGLVTGNVVLLGPARVGTVNSIGLTANGQARVTMSIDGSAAPLHRGTVARIYQDSLSGIASKYVELEPASRNAPAIASGGLITATHTYSNVPLDAVFDSLDPLTRAGLKGIIRGEAASLQGRGHLANQALKYLAPGLESTSQVTAELTRDEPVFDQLVVQGAQAMQALASRSEQLSQLIANTSTATGAIADRSRALTEALTLLPGTLRRSTTTFRGLDATIDTLDRLVTVAKPAVRRLPAFAASLNTLLGASIPTLAELNALIRNPAGTGDLTELARQTPSLQRIAASAFPELIRQFNDSEDQVATLRQYTPDVVAALANVGQAGANYDANGHFLRSAPLLYPFTVDGAGQLTAQPPARRYDGLVAARGRCPGSAVQPTPDGSAPRAVAGCQTAAVPPGP